ncbi:HD domain-containing protein [Patescibacteria group bacterium]|nr:HD domain-containing protein [Patescibacteria group bacterium]
MKKYINILKKYSDSKNNFNVVLNHSLVVLAKSFEIIARKNLSSNINADLIVSGCLLHDIGTFEFMKSIHKLQIDYLRHGIIGGEILRSEGLNKEALIAERHIGSGLSKEYIIKKNLPLPKRDFLPITLEQKLICYADKFHSKSGKIDTLASIEKEMKGFGKESFQRFLELKILFK